MITAATSCAAGSVNLSRPTGSRLSRLVRASRGPAKLDVGGVYRTGDARSGSPPRRLRHLTRCSARTALGSGPGPGASHADHGTVETPAFMPVGTAGTVRPRGGRPRDAGADRPREHVPHAVSAAMSSGSSAGRTRSRAGRPILWTRRVLGRPRRRRRSEGSPLPSHVDGSPTLTPPGGRSTCNSATSAWTSRWSSTSCRGPRFRTGRHHGLTHRWRLARACAASLGSPRRLFGTCRRDVS